AFGEVSATLCFVAAECSEACAFSIIFESTSQSATTLTPLQRAVAIMSSWPRPPTPIQATLSLLFADEFCPRSIFGIAKAAAPAAVDIRKNRREVSLDIGSLVRWSVTYI